MDREEITPLIVLQNAQNALDAVEQALLEIPQKLEQLDQEQSEVTLRRDTVRHQMEAAKRNLRSREGELQDLKEKLTRYNRQLYEVKNNKEYSAMVAEIAATKDRISTTEEVILTAMLEVDELGEKLKQVEAIFQDESTVISSRRQEIEVLKQELDQRSQVLCLELDKAKSAIPEKLMAEYLRIRNHTTSTVLARAVHQGNQFVCNGCYMNIPAQIISELKQGKIYQCEACARYLYWSEDEN